MKKLSKKLTVAKSKVEVDKKYSLENALKLAKETSFTKFDGTINLVFKLNLDVRQADQQLRGAIALPNGTGRSVRVLVAVENPSEAEAAKLAGAEYVLSGGELKEVIEGGKFDFDVIITDPKLMPVLGKYGKVLGPKGLMPNPKTGTVTPQVAKAVAEIKKGKANYRTDKAGIVHTAIGKVSMDLDKLVENALIVVDTIKKLKPSAVKGAYIQNVSVSATMGPGIKVELV